MSLGTKPDQNLVALNATLTTNVLAPPGTGLTRAIRHIKVVNGGAAATWSLSLKAAGVAPVVTDPGLIGLTVAIAANSSQDLTWGGDGLLQSASGAQNITGGASAATVSIHVEAVLYPS
jgi:hypothetical protein